MRTTRILMVIGLACGLLAASGARAEETSDAKAVDAGKAWLALVDAGSYGESWDAAATLFKNTITRDGWVKALEGARMPFGALHTRELAGSQRATSLPGAPDGTYVVMQFHTAFEHKASAIETLTVMLEKDGAWRAAGYFIK